MLALVLTACQRAAPVSLNSYQPGLGELMGQTQIRHAKLWFAGMARNWELAAYELEELQEGLDDAVRYHPTHKEVRDSLSRLVPQFLGNPMDALRNAVASRDTTRFREAYDALSAGCNGCHETAAFGFNRVRRPTAPPFTNQEFAPTPQNHPASAQP